MGRKRKNPNGQMELFPGAEPEKTKTDIDFPETSETDLGDVRQLHLPFMEEAKIEQSQIRHTPVPQVADPTTLMLPMSPEEAAKFRRRCKKAGSRLGRCHTKKRSSIIVRGHRIKKRKKYCFEAARALSKCRRQRRRRNPGPDPDPLTSPIFTQFSLVPSASAVVAGFALPKLLKMREENWRQKLASLGVTVVGGVGASCLETGSPWPGIWGTAIAVLGRSFLLWKSS